MRKLSAATERYEALAERFYRETGMMAPGKDVPAAMGGPDYDVRFARWEKWIAALREGERETCE